MLPPVVSDAELARREDGARKLLARSTPDELAFIAHNIAKYGMHIPRLEGLEKVPVKSDLWDANALKDPHRSTYFKKKWQVKSWIRLSSRGMALL
jgi:hypothetical protein